VDGGVVVRVKKEMESGPRRFRGLRRVEIGGRRVPVAATARSRLLGLAGLGRTDAGPGLLIPDCRSVHTFGMRFPLDLVFLDANLLPVRVRRGVAPRRIAVERRARSVLELPSPWRGGEG
jgi:uncharacterized membrane protein (UPF0127 family)